MNESRQVIPIERIQQKIFVIRGEKVMLDRDLAELYGVTTFNLNKAVARNIDRFPNDFMFQLSTNNSKELNRVLSVLRSHGGRRKLAYTFTEHGVTMLSAVLKSERAVIVSVQIMRTFVKLRELLLTNKIFARRLRAFEAKTDEHAKVIIQII